MKKLLIVEDEKMIRNGIRAMVEDSSVAVEEIILCKNGEEAYEILTQQKIDVMITDIRMPKKDGITLVKDIQHLKDKPKVVVISGYDDFSYAVELLRCGVKEYLLKPIERHRVNEILVKMEEELVVENNKKEDMVKLGYQQLRYMLVHPGTTKEEIIRIQDTFKDSFIAGDYVVCCTNYQADPPPLLRDYIFLDDINEQSIFIVKIEHKEALLSGLLERNHVGISRIHHSIEDLQRGFQESLNARKIAFATGVKKVEFLLLDYEECSITEEEIDQFVQMIGTDKLLVANEFLKNILQQTKAGKIKPDDFLNLMNSIVDKITFNYKNLLNFHLDNIMQLKHVFQYDCASDYYLELINWMKQINQRLIREFGGYKNKSKIKKAIRYIQENFNKDLNMAVVSNHVSMNYSLFSYSFKEYTNMNFVTYLKTIRLDEAKRLLEQTDSRVIDISKLVGYENEKHFMKTFKNSVGVSPSEYRKNVQVGKNNL